MANVYDGKVDDRQSEDQQMVTSRFRPKYRALSDDEKRMHDEIKNAFEEVEKQITRVPDGRYKSLALTSLEESCMWAIKELTK